MFTLPHNEIFVKPCVFSADTQIAANCDYKIKKPAFSIISIV